MLKTINYNMEIKNCTKCKTEYPKTLEYFYVRSEGNKNRLKSWCKICCNEYQKKWIEKNKEEYNDWQKLYNKQNYEKNKKKYAKNNKKWREKNPEKLKNIFLKRSFGITLEEYNQMLEKQDGKCGICGGINKNGKALCVDHDHKTGEIRGLLCSKCNRGIGSLNENPFILIKTIKYLRKKNEFNIFN